MLLVIFALAKVAFMVVHGSFGEIFRVWWHGLPLDLATAGYLSAPVWLLCFWYSHDKKWDKIYSGVLAVVLSLIFVSDTCLYSFWGFKLDSTIFTYLDKPEGALNSVSVGYVIGVIVAWALAAGAIFLLLRHALKPRVLITHPKFVTRTVALIFIGGLMFLAIRGGVGRSTANVGMVYYSDNEYYNHCAVNPAFSLISSWLKSSDLGENAQFYTDDERKALIDSLLPPKTEQDTTLLTVANKPARIVWILMEGCGMKMYEKDGLLPNLHKLADEGVLLANCYANSFRTDRGVLCSLSGYPSFPDVSVMKAPAKSRTLPSVANVLKSAGYACEFLYGGDKNFTNMNSYLLSTGYRKTYGDEDFSSDERKTHAWGVADGIVLNRAVDLLVQTPPPYFMTVLTLSSHEPWEVPYDRIKNDDKANSFAYLDDCIGQFVTNLKKKGLWDSTLLVVSSDHGIPWPDATRPSNPDDWKIPVIFAGGVVKQRERFDAICQQSDIAATLMGLLGLSHESFRWSRNVLSTRYAPQLALHTWGGGVGFIDTTGTTVWGLPTYSVIGGKSDARRERSMKALLQEAYEDLKGR